jgi:hypothetical protein
MVFNQSYTSRSNRFVSTNRKARHPHIVYNLTNCYTLVPSPPPNITTQPLLELYSTTTRPPLCLLLKILSPMVRSCKLVGTKLWSSCTFPPTKRLLLRPLDYTGSDPEKMIFIITLHLSSGGHRYF